MSTIQNDANELKNLNIEIKRLSNQLKTLRNKSKNVEKRITEYLKEKNQPGIKHQDTAIFLDHKEKRSTISRTEKEDNALSILKRYNISNPKEVLEELLESRKGTPLEFTKIKITKIK